jgi:hypothetical protein
MLGRLGYPVLLPLVLGLLGCALGSLDKKDQSPTDAGPSAGGPDAGVTYDSNGVAAQEVRVTTSGSTATGTYTVLTNRAVTFRELVLAVRDAANANQDFIWNGDVTVTGTQTFSGSRSGLGDGTYTAVVAYTLDGSRWFDVGPKINFLVGSACVPTTCAAQGKDCDTISDGCGGTLSCGSCTAPQSCGGGGVANVCGTDACVPTTCATQGKDCDTISDGCGGTLSCGSCAAPETCGGGGVANVCGETSPSDGFGLLASGQRDKFKWPFASSSIWNTPIGSAATYQPANIVFNSSSGYSTSFVQDQDVVVMTPTAPVTAVYQNNVGWSGGDRCPAQGGVLTRVPVPASFTLPNSGENNSAAFLAADGHTILQNQPFTRCTAGASATTLVTFGNEDIYGPGVYGAHGGSNLSALGGTIRLGEFTSGKIHHVMKVNLWAKQYYYCCDYHWPARVVDGYADSTTYGGSNKNFGPGSLLALLPSYDVSALRTAPGRILAQAFKDYGAYVVDDTYWNAWALITEQGPSGRVVDEFQSLYGFSMRPAQGDAFMADMKDIFQALEIVTNNSSNNVGGGGTPRVPLAPAIGN